MEMSKRDKGAQISGQSTDRERGVKTVNQDNESPKHHDIQRLLSKRPTHQQQPKQADDKPRQCRRQLKDKMNS